MSSMGYYTVVLEGRGERSPKTKHEPTSALAAELADAMVRWQGAQGDAAVAIAVAVTAVTSELQAQHVCVALDTLSNALSLASADSLEGILLKQGVASRDGNSSAPLVIDDKRLYLRRQFEREGLLARALCERAAGRVEIDAQEAVQRLVRLYPDDVDDQVNWQRVAAATALSSGLTVITGGPGTGKTTTVTGILALLCWTDDSVPPPRVAIAAPTGKAAARLAQAIGHAKQGLAQKGVPSAVIARLPEQATTLHRLLGYRSDSQQFRYHADEPLPLDVLVVDEASMLDLRLALATVQALPKHARLILLGDRDQLASVDAGSVLADICGGLDRHFESARFSVSMSNRLQALTGYDFSSLQAEHVAPIADALVWLRKRYRFTQGSDVARLAEALSEPSRLDEAQSLLVTPDDPVSIVRRAADRYAVLCRIARSDEALPTRVAALLEQAPRYQLLAAVREGRFGVESLNRKIARVLAERFGTRAALFPGALVMATVNDYRLGIFNGDIGVTTRADDDGLVVTFRSEQGMQFVSPARLPGYELAFALTVHKAQGSEFDEVEVVIPPNPSENERRILTRELLYTAVTRAKQRATLHCGSELLRSIAGTRAERNTGLKDRLWGADH